MTPQILNQNLNIETMQTTAVFDENGILHTTEPLPGRDGETVQIVVIRVKNDAKELPYDASELTAQQWEHGASVLVTADFADDPAEDIYSFEDGKPFDASQY